MDQNKSVLKTSREFIIDDLMELVSTLKKRSMKFRLIFHLFKGNFIFKSN